MDVNGKNEEEQVDEVDNTIIYKELFADDEPSSILDDLSDVINKN